MEQFLKEITKENLFYLLIMQISVTIIIVAILHFTTKHYKRYIEIMHNMANQISVEAYEGREVIRKLVELKDLKEREGETLYYQRWKPLTWLRAKEFLRKTEPVNAKDIPHG